MVIDETTGLPELPEGQWWRVEEEEAPGLAVYAKSIQVSIVERYREYRKEHRYRVNWFGRYVPSGLTIDLWTDNDRVLRTQTIYSEKPGIWGYYPVPRNEVTHGDVLRTAKLIIESRDREIAAAALLGDYPPKKLGAL